ncbi:type II toxin-antitoxin system VapC family toxin [Jiangella muralis]|uniref:type II toxin-antitoxin system VapC family toxin n=1 Tax=Jiangella muralis TaxID=702383 RepID=UPI00069DD71A|nr:type II toxin-antitoxin system VapC family toxin [Jiangella muralis]
MARRYVLDASAGIAILNHTSSGVALAAFRFRPGAETWTVEHFHVEVAKVIRRDVLRGDLTDTQAGQLVTGLVRWPLNVARVAPLISDAWTMRHTITIHDGLYVALARHIGATLVTADRKLAKAPGMDVPVIAPS